MSSGKDSKPGRYVTSRYKVAAKKVAQSSKNDVSSKKQSNSSDIKINILDVTPAPCMDADGTGASSSRVTSTPAVANLLLPSCSGISMIEPLESQPKTNFLSKNFTTFVKKDAKFKKPLPTTRVTKAQEAATSIHNEEAELDLLYAQYLQAKYLEILAKQTFELSSKNALEGIYKIWYLIQKLLEGSKTCENNLDILSHMLDMRDSFCKQEEFLTSLVDDLPDIMSLYQEVVEAVDSVRHKLLVNNLSLLEVPHFEDDISKLSGRIVTLLNDFILKFPEHDRLTSAANSFSQSVSDGQSLKDAIKKCTDLLKTSDELLISETSLSFELL